MKTAQENRVLVVAAVPHCSPARPAGRADSQLDVVVPDGDQRRRELTFATRISTQGGASAYVSAAHSVTESSSRSRKRAYRGAAFMGGLLLSVFGAYFIARSITRPVSSLVQAVRRSEHGDYVPDVECDQQDEIGELAGAFQPHGEGLVERDKVRDRSENSYPLRLPRSCSRATSCGRRGAASDQLFSDCAISRLFSEQRRRRNRWRCSMTTLPA